MDNTDDELPEVPDTLPVVENVPFPNPAEEALLENFPFPDPAEEEEALLKQLGECMESLLKFQWDTTHNNRALFSDIDELKKLRKEGNKYVINNYIPERKHTNYLHPVNYVLFTGQVTGVKNTDTQRIFQVKDETESIFVIEDIRVKGERNDDYRKIHEVFRNCEKKYKEIVDPTINDQFALNIRGSLWLLARRRSEISPQKKQEHFIGDLLMVLGRLWEFNGTRRVYARKIACINKEHAAWIRKNLLIGRWYEDEFKAKNPERF